MNSAYFSYTRVIAVVALATGIFVLYPAKLFFLNDDFTHLYLTSKGEWLQHNSFRPICDLSMWIDYNIWGLNAFGFHITNILLHLFSTYLVGIFCFRLLDGYQLKEIAKSNAILIATIFFVYCFHSETLFWIIGRSASLGTVFFLLSIISYLNRKNSRSYFFSLLFLSAGLMTYESVLIIPFVFLILSWLDVKRNSSSWKAEAKYLIAPFCILIGYFIARYYFIHQLVGEYEGEKFLNLDITGLGWNWLKLILRSFSRQSGSFFLLVIAFLITTVSILSFLFLRQRILVVSLLLLWMISYLPYLSLGIDTFGSEGERYLYLPSVFLSIIIGLGIVNAAKSFKYIISLAFFTIHIILLNEFKNEYEVASAVTKATVDQFKKIESQTIYIKQLPEENNGAIIFRSGIEEAYQLYGQTKNARIVVQSIYKGNYMFFVGVNEQEWANELPGVEGKDAVLDYSNSILTVYR